jgi:hypothetical protein
MTDDQAATAAEPCQLTRNDIGRRYGSCAWEAIDAAVLARLEAEL